eukprot:15463785-Heterocapsa_arctica.AAC.1
MVTGRLDAGGRGRKARGSPSRQQCARRSAKGKLRKQARKIGLKAAARAALGIVSHPTLSLLTSSTYRRR